MSTKKLWAANTFFEKELSSQKLRTLPEWMQSDPIHEQLQFIPFLFAGKEDGVLVTAKPEKDFLEKIKNMRGFAPELILFDATEIKNYEELLSWGSSPSVELFAKEHNLQYNAVSSLVAKKIQARDFLFSEELAGSVEEVQKKCQEEGFFVIKKLLSSAGRGHKIISNKTPADAIHSFCKREWEKGQKVLVERWLKKEKDFSSIWDVRKDGSFIFLSWTHLLCDEKGRYIGTEIGTCPIPEAIAKEHMCAAQEEIKRAVASGYFGLLVFDALLFDKDKTRIVEVNARLSMGYVAFRLHKELYATKKIRLELKNPEHRPLLPQKIERADRTFFTFPYNLSLKIN